jgi:peroxiredoxin
VTRLHATALAALACACATSGGSGLAPASADAAAPATDFTLRDVEGRDVRLSDFEGQVVLLNFWATWCVPCEAEFPHLQRIWETHKDRGFTVLAIAMDGPETIANVASFARRYRLGFPVLLDEETKVVGIYNPKRTAPLSLIIDRQGRIARQRQGFSPGDERMIEDDVVALLDR